MFDSKVLETVIGLFSMFLGLALVTTAIQEFVASGLKLRAKTLQSGLKDMLADGQKGLQFYNQIIGHPLVSVAGSKPSYVAATQFSNAVIHVLSGGSTTLSTPAQLRMAILNHTPAPYRDVILSLIRDAEPDLKPFQQRLENWFDNGMDRISGIYKRWSQIRTLVISASLAFVLQANTFFVVAALWAECAQDKCVHADTTMQGAMRGLATFHLVPLWDSPPSSFDWDWVIGCVITAIAVSLGAPFWFDVLQSFVNLRGTGPVPKKSA